MSFHKYLDVVSGNFRKAVKVEWLNPDETVNFEFTNSLYDINIDLSVNYQNGSRRSCSLTLNNDKNQFPINFDNIWFGQKFKLWMGVYIDEKTPYYFPQGVFYVSNPNEIYQPSTRTIKINGLDKWAFLDGTLHGKLSGTYQTNIGVSLYEATRELLHTPRSIPSKAITNNNIESYFYVINSDYYFKYDGSAFTSNNSGKNNSIAKTILTAKRNMLISFMYSYSSEHNYDKFTLEVGGAILENAVSGDTTIKTYRGFISEGQSITFQYSKDGSGSKNDDKCSFFDMFVEIEHLEVIDPIPPFISPYFLTKTTTINDEEVEVWKCPYTAKVERGKTYADILLEYATILCAHIYYDVNGHLVIEPMIDTADDITDTNKEVVWHFTVEEKQLLGLTQTYNFDKVYNDIIVLGNIVNGYQFKARVQNRNIMSDTCVQKIGLKTKEPLEDNQYYSDEQCQELAMYYAKVDTILQKSGNIDSTPLYHLDVNNLVTVSTPNNNMSKELFLITGFTLNSSDKMSINVTSVNVLKDFSVVGVDVYE